MDEETLAKLLKVMMSDTEVIDEDAAEETEENCETSVAEEPNSVSQEKHVSAVPVEETARLIIEDAKLEAKKILEQARLDAMEASEKLLEQTRKTALKEADDIKAQVLYEKGRLKEQELFFDKKMDILKAGFAQLEADKQAFERTKREEMDMRAKTNYYAGPGEGQAMLFAGVNSLLAVKKRYKDLIKIFHPDNLCGDTEVLQMINREYEKLMDEFGWGRKVY